MLYDVGDEEQFQAFRRETAQDLPRLYAAIGRALTSAAMLDSAVSEALGAVLGSDVAVYASEYGLGKQLGMMEKAIKAPRGDWMRASPLDPEIGRVLRQASMAVRAGIKHRNDLAHREWTVFYPEGATPGIARGNKFTRWEHSTVLTTVESIGMIDQVLNLGSGVFVEQAALMAGDMAPSAAQDLEQLVQEADAIAARQGFVWDEQSRTVAQS